MLSLVTTKVFTDQRYPFKTVSCIFSKKSHIIIDLSFEPEMMYLLSLVTATHLMWSECPFKTVFSILSKRFHILIVQSQETEIIYLLSLLTAKPVTGEMCPFNAVSSLLSKSSYSYSIVSKTRNDVFVVTSHYYTTHIRTMSFQNTSWSLYKRFHIITLSSLEPEITYLLYFVSAKLVTPPMSPSKINQIWFELFFNFFHISRKL